MDLSSCSVAGRQAVAAACLSACLPACLHVPACRHASCYVVLCASKLAGACSVADLHAGDSCRDVLTSEELDELNVVWDAHVRGRTLDANRFSQTITDDHGNKYAGRRFWSAAYRSLIDHPKIYPILQEMLTDPRWGHAPPGLPLEYRGRIRLDHDNIVHLPAYDPEQMETHGWGAKTLHGNPQNWHVTTVFELKSIGKDEGGFGAAAGTHKREGQARLLNMGLTTEEWRTQWCEHHVEPWLQVFKLSESF